MRQPTFGRLSGLGRCHQPRVAPKALFSTSFSRTMASHGSEHGIENTNFSTADGVTLDDKQKTLVGCVLDLFAGRPSLKKLQLWEDDAIFEDPITVAKGRKQYEPQWYGLQAMFSNIERLSHSVTSAGNPIAMDLKTKYVVKGMGTEKIIDSKILIHYSEGTGRVTSVQDKWNGELPTSSFADALRKLNANTVPHLVSVPKSDEEDAARLQK